MTLNRFFVQAASKRFAWMSIRVRHLPQSNTCANEPMSTTATANVMSLDPVPSLIASSVKDHLDIAATERSVSSSSSGFNIDIADCVGTPLSL